MSPEDSKMFDDYFDLFSRPGWARIIEDLNTNVKNIETVYNIKDLEGLWYSKGKLDALNNLITFRDTIELLYDDMRSPDAEETL